MIYISSTAVYGVPEEHPIYEDEPLVGVGHYGASKIEAERICREFAQRGLETVIIRPKTFIGPERLGVFEILFDWIRDGRRITMLGDGSNRYQLLAVEDLVDAIVLAAERRVAGEAINVGAQRVRHRSLRPAGADRPRRLVVAADARCRPARPRLRCVCSSCCSFRRSPSGTTRPRTGTRSSTSAGRSGYSAGRRGSRMRRLSARPTTGTSRIATRRTRAGVTHRVPWNQQALALLKKVS